MPRIQYSFPSGEVAQQMISRRGGQLTPLDLLLAHNDSLAAGWNSLLGAVRSDFSLPGDIRELVILRIGRLNQASYEWDAHLPVARRQGLPEHVITALDAHAQTTGNPMYDVVLRYTDAMTRNVIVPDSLFASLQEHYDDTGITELTATIAVYNMVSRFLVALDVQTVDRTTVPESSEAQLQARPAAAEETR